MRYRMLLEHDRIDFSHGLDEAAYGKPDAVFWVGPGRSRVTVT